MQLILAGSLKLFGLNFRLWNSFFFGTFISTAREIEGRISQFVIEIGHESLD